MTLRISPGRPLARLVVRAAGAGRRTRSLWHVPSYSPPIPGRTRPVGARDGPEHQQVDLAEKILYGLLSALPDGAESLLNAEAAVIAPDVVVWSPTVYATSRDEVSSVLRPGRDADDSLTDVQVAVVAIDVVGGRVYIEWRLTARFANPCFIDDDLLIEPSGRIVETSGVQVATFRAGQLVRVNCYYDDLGLLEQIVT